MDIRFIVQQKRMALIKELNAKGLQIDCDLTVDGFVRAVKQKGESI